ncbi:MAG: DUF4832 domain-containing protein [Marinoscillum sp.]|uniref:DUF4832 domain-containing protein n=1 Tax=Marinoscillum sp. TaxID=2024838 RepID=UPI003300C31A
MTNLYNRIVPTMLLLLSILVGCKDKDPSPDSNPATNTSNTVHYTPSMESFPNPERGFLHLTAVFSEGSPLTQSALQNLRNDNISLVWRLYYFEKFKQIDLSQAQLDLIQTDMDNLRSVGLKCVLRFAYTNNSDDGTDAPIEIVERHLDQLKPLFKANADVIAFVNAGFAGLWGEWHSSSNNLTALANQKRIVTKLLEVIPSEIKIQLRTPRQKRDVFGEQTAMTDEIGYSDAAIARVGHHNDCFMASDNDYGTYDNPTTDKNYISQEAFYVPTGGETCPPSGVDAADCEEARETMSLLKWSYLNLDWYKPIIDGWKSEGCFEEFERDMGYRLALDSTIIDSVMSKSTSLDIAIYLYNHGWAPIYNHKTVSLVLSPTSGDPVRMILDVDIRKARPGESFNITETIDLSDVPTGTYVLYLHIADQFESIAERPEYSVRLANENVWDSNTGWNDLLQTIEITE